MALECSFKAFKGSFLKQVKLDLIVQEQDNSFKENLHAVPKRQAHLKSYQYS